MKRLVAAVLSLALCAGGALAADSRKVLRLAIPDIETLDPQQYAESPSFDVLRAIYEGLYQFDYLAKPPRLTPVTATALPEITNDGRTWTMHVQPGIYFTPDPAFKGRKRELTAEDYVYSLKRWLDPNSKRGGAPITAAAIVGGRAAGIPIARSTACARSTATRFSCSSRRPTIRSSKATSRSARWHARSWKRAAATFAAMPSERARSA
jgi:ABC-type transport system substrate-binding protein